MSIFFDWRTFIGAMLASSAFCICGQPALAQNAITSPSPSHVVIPFLASATRSADLDFEGAECDRDAAGNTMACTFQQVFLTTSDLAPDTCLITTNQYARNFRRDGDARWVSSEGPEGVCGVLDVATLQDDGGVRWTLEMHQVTTKRDASPTCRAFDPPAETFSWQNIRRALPCKFVQPGGLSR